MAPATDNPETLGDVSRVCVLLVPMSLSAHAQVHRPPPTFRERVLNAIGRRLPPTTAGHFDRLRPSLAPSWGGPFNGQLQRRRIVRDIAKALDFDLVLETGTYRGTSTEFLVAVFDVPRLATVEGHPRYFTYAQKRLSVYPHVECVLGDSRAFLRDEAKRPPEGNVFIYLDAHWEEDLPLTEELEIIADGFPRAVVMMDDFQVPDDDGYYFDWYAPDRALMPDLIIPPALDAWDRFYPAAPSSEETGSKSGCCVLVSPAVELDIASLRRL